MRDFLEDILKHKREVNCLKKDFFYSVKEKLSREKYTPYHLFKRLISKPGGVNLIAEIKKASPSRGLLRADFDPVAIARIYEMNNAAAISVLTEDKYFLGKPMYLRTVSENFSVPVLTKDFIIDEVQIYEALTLGASAVLLIAAISTDEELKHLLGITKHLDLDALVEVHDEKELGRALSAGAEIIGVNHRDLHTFTVDLKVSERLIPKIPKDKVIVAESGIKSHDEVKMLKGLGVHAVLIGETFLESADIGKKVKEVMEGKS